MAGRILARLPVTGVVSAVLGVAAVAWYYYSFSERARDATSTDPGLLQKGTRFESYRTTSGHHYPKIRTFYHEHPQAKKLPDNLPLLVFIHGLGGSAAQFTNLLTSMVNIAPCLAIDLPGCGRSEFLPTEDDAYTTVAFAELLFAAIDRYRDESRKQKIVLFGHSMGCSIATLLAASNSPLAGLCSVHVLGLVAICPRSTVPSDQQLRSIQRLQWIWSPIFDLLRLYDRAGGINSASVLRIVGKDADSETRRLQLRLNQQSSSAVFQKVLRGIYLQETASREKGEESLLGWRTWAGLKMPLFLVAAENDKLAPPKEIEQISDWLNPRKVQPSDHSANDNARHDSKTDWQNLDNVALDERAVFSPISTSSGTPVLAVDDSELVKDQLSRYKPIKLSKDTKTAAVVEEEHISTKHAFVLKTIVFPEPSSHGLLYAQKDVRILSSMVERFLGKYIDERLSPTWQLQHLTKSGKWDVKNLNKWQAIDPCSRPIAGIFRAAKTMREIDGIHNPKQFVSKFSYKIIPDGVAMIVDISHDVPVYNKEGLEQSGVEYHKFPTVSKQPPTLDEVEHFAGLIDTLRQSDKITSAVPGKPHPTIGVHCHYGFNRTGFFICAYVVEKEGWKVEDAIAEFAEKRPPGIKHDHFVNELYARYATKIQRRNTIVG